jgi:hypothetical protein
MTEPLTRYERLVPERASLLWAVIPPPFLIAVLAGAGACLLARTISLRLLTLPALVVSSVVAYHFGKKALTALWPWYQGKIRALSKVDTEIQSLTHRMAEFYESVPKRSSRSLFKKHYDLGGKTLQEFERLLAIGMRHERREVWVAAFCRGEMVTRVTATIGSVYRCRPSDDLSRWPYHAQKLHCNSIRLYHNHPGSCRSTISSPQDRRTARIIAESLAVAGLHFSSYIVFWNEIGEYRITEYEDDGSQRLVQIFDAAA